MGTTADTTVLKDIMEDEKETDVEISRGENTSSANEEIKEESKKTKVKVKKRNIMSRANTNEFPEFDEKTTDDREKKEIESNVPENIDEEKKSKVKNNGQEDLSTNEKAEPEVKLTKQKKKKMRRVRVKKNKIESVTNEDGKETEEELK